MKINFEVELDEEKLKIDVVSGCYNLTDRAIDLLRESIVSQILLKIDAKSFGDEMTTSFARLAIDKIQTLSIEKLKTYLSDEAIKAQVDRIIKYNTENWLKQNINEYFSKTKDYFMFMSKEDFDNEIANAKDNN
jgi:hypothetical protein